MNSLRLIKQVSSNNLDASIFYNEWTKELDTTLHFI